VELPTLGPQRCAEEDRLAEVLGSSTAEACNVQEAQDGLQLPGPAQAAFAVRSCRHPRVQFGQRRARQRIIFYKWPEGGRSRLPTRQADPISECLNLESILALLDSSWLAKLCGRRQHWRPLFMGRWLEPDPYEARYLWLGLHEARQVG